MIQREGYGLLLYTKCGYRDTSHIEILILSDPYQSPCLICSSSKMVDDNFAGGIPCETDLLCVMQSFCKKMSGTDDPDLSQ